MDKHVNASRYPIPTALNLAVVIAQLTTFAAIVAGATHATTWPHVLLLSIAFAVLGNSIYAVVHEAEHRMLHPNRRVNDLIGVLMALLFPAPFHLIRQGHIGHHMRNRSDDEAFDHYFDDEKRWLKCVQFYGILTGLYWLTVVIGNLVVLLAPKVLQRRFFQFDRPSAALMDSLNPRYWRMIRIEALAAIALHVTIVFGLNIHWVTYLAIYFGFGWSWSAMQYAHHFDTPRHVTDGTRDLWIGWPLDTIWLHHNWHRAHHADPTVPWVYLPGLGKAGESKRRFLPWQYLLMWRGPRYTNEHVENKYAGQVIR